MRRSVRWGEATREASGYKSVQTKERLQATRADKQKRGFRLQERSNKRQATTVRWLHERTTKERLQLSYNGRLQERTMVQTKRVYNKNVRAVTTKTYVRMGLS